MTQTAPERQIVMRSVEALIPFANNARTHSDAQIANLAGSVREFGWTNPVLIDGESGIIAGHGRVMAARKLGMAEVPCIELSGLSETQKRAYVIADNQHAVAAGWNDELLSLELGDLADAGVDMGLLGFSQEEIDALMSPAGADAAGTGDGDASSRGSLSDKFMLPPFSVLNAREGWWQERKRAWLALGIKSELGRGGGLTMEAEQVTSPGLNYYRGRKQGAAPGGSPRPAADYSKRQRGNGAGRAIDA